MQELKAQYGMLYDSISKILFFADIMDIGTVENDLFTEYEPELHALLPKLETAQSSNDTLYILLSVFADFFGQISRSSEVSHDQNIFKQYKNSPESTTDKYDIAAKKIWELVQSQHPTLASM